MKKSRSENRILCAGLVEVCWSDMMGHACSVIANLEEISTRAVHLTVEVPVPRGTPLALHMARGDMTATVSTCRHEPGFGFAITVQLPKRGHWTSHLRHLLDPRGLQRRAVEQQSMA